MKEQLKNEWDIATIGVLDTKIHITKLELSPGNLWNLDSPGNTHIDHTTITEGEATGPPGDGGMRAVYSSSILTSFLAISSVIFLNSFSRLTELF